jgi:hypothetical protein
MTGLDNRLIASVLIELPTGYIFTPYGAYGKAFIVARGSSDSVVRGAVIFCFSALPLMAFIAAAGIYARAVHSPLSFLVAAALGVIWMGAYFVWTTTVTRGLIEHPRHGAGADDAR